MTKTDLKDLYGMTPVRVLISTRRIRGPSVRFFFSVNLLSVSGIRFVPGEQ